MKKFIHKNFWIIGLGLLMFISLLLHAYKLNEVPPCLNADEAAFGYNAYSILKTGRDEYGTLLPLRLKSFGDYKMPLYSYILVPFIAVFGLNEFAVRLPNVLFGILLVPSVFYLAHQFFRDKRIAFLGTFIFTTSLWPYILSRHAHEAVLCTLLLTLSFGTYFSWIRNRKTLFFVISLLLLFLSQFAYHPARIFGMIYMLIVGIDLWKKNINKSLANASLLIVCGTIIMSPFIIDLFYNPQRITRLFFTQDGSFKQRIQKAVDEDKNRIIHNELTESIKTVTNNYLRQISYEFLLVDGDKDIRFGMKGMGFINLVSYVMSLSGMYFLIKKKEIKIIPIIILLFFTPLINALTWREPSIGRTYFFIIPFSILAGYGANHVMSNIDSIRRSYTRFFIIIGLTIFYIFFFINGFDAYLYHYPKDKQSINAWQCGYKEAVKKAYEVYNDMDKIYVTKRHGQPYIFFLFYGKVEPKEYQKQAFLSELDEYGYGQIQHFGKFNFEFNTDNLSEKKTMWIGYPEQLEKADQKKVQKILYGEKHQFSIYQNK